MPVPNTPPTPTYQGASGSTPSTQGPNPDDIFNLGKLYGQPIYLGTQVVDQPTGGEHSGPGTYRENQTSFGTTQDIFTSAKKMWEQQSVERKKNPDGLTSFEQLQQELWQAGFYGQTSYDSVHVGQWTKQTEAALKEAVTSYEHTVIGPQKAGQVTSASPTTFTEFLQQNQTFGQDGGQTSKTSASAKPAPPPPVSLQDPESIKQAAQTAAMDALGHGLTDDQLQRFVQQFQAAQTAAHQQAYADGSTNYTDPDLTSQASSFAQSADPNGYQANQKQAYVSALVNLFAGPGDVGRPQQGVTPKA